MKLKLAITFAVLLFACAVRAESVSAVEGYNVTIPDGSTVVSETIYPGPLGVPDPYATVDYTFADGYGTSTSLASGDGSFGSISFAEPVSSLSFTWFSGDGFYFEATIADEGNTVGSVYCESVCPPSAMPQPKTSSFTGPVDGITWSAADFGGITSMAYTPVPEPSSLLLLGMGLVALISLKSKA
jgi:hypothetical protein